MVKAGKKKAGAPGSSSSTAGGSRKTATKVANKKASKSSSSSAATKTATGAAKSRNNSKGKQQKTLESISGSFASSSSVSAAKATKFSKKGASSTSTTKEKVKNGIREFIPTPGLKRGKKASTAAGEREEEEEGSGSDDESEGDDDDDQVDVDDMLLAASDDEEEDGQEGGADGLKDRDDFARRAQFLANLDTKGIARSRAALAEEYKKSKPAPQQAQASSSRVALPKIGPAVVNTNEDDEEDLDALSDDDFAKLGSDDEDGMSDELSVMSDGSLDSRFDDVDDSLDGLSDDSLSDEEVDDEDEGEDSWTGFESDQDGESQTSSHTLISDDSVDEDNDDLENQYARLQAKKQRREEYEASKKGPSRLPIKTADGIVAKRGNKKPITSDGVSSDEASDVEDEGEASSDDDTKRNRVTHKRPLPDSDQDDESEEEKLRKKMKASKAPSNPFGARFGRPSVVSVLEIEDRIERLMAAREELAILGREIVAEPELGMNLLRRLLSFSMPVFLVPGQKKDEGLQVDLPIRSLAILSLLAVFLDIIPGYRIRAITEAEKTARTSQAVIQQREFEEGLVNSYRSFLEMCENEIKKSTLLAPVALKCLCELLKEKSHFNFAVNIMEIVVKTVGRREFDKSSQLCVNTLSQIFRDDASGYTSLELVKLLSRTIKARSYLVHPAVLTCLLSIRFQDLGGIRASTDRIERDRPRQQQPHRYHNDKKGRKGANDKPYMNKKTRKVLKEKKEIEKEIAEAENVVKEEERSHNSTETLKLLFALYFRILKLPVEQKSELLPPALEGLARFATLINVDFFRDLLNVLKDIMGQTRDIRIELLCVVTALQLLTGQGEALNIDLTAFITHLYGSLVPLTLCTTIEDKPKSDTDGPRAKGSYSTLTEAELLFRALHSIFLTSRLPNPPVRTLAFSKRILIACLHWPKNTALRGLDFLRQLLIKERTLEMLLNTEDVKKDGVYNYSAEDENLSNPEASVLWELGLLERSHFDEEVRSAASRLARWSKED